MSVDPKPTSSGKWKVRWRDPSRLGQDGKPVAGSKNFTYKKDADAFDREVRGAVETGQPIPDGRVAAVTFNQLADDWLRLDARVRLDKGTVED